MITEPTSDTHRKILERVRALLAKAESTTFAEEAAALSAKAHELMAAHAIDMALIEEQQGRGEVMATTILIPAPYAKEKYLLLGSVARGNRCQAVLGVERDVFRDMVESGEMPDYGDGRVATVVGYQSDLNNVEILFTSLLLQAVNSALAHGSIVAPWGENRTRSFRRSFLISFAYTIGDRFEATKQRAAAEADSASSGNVLPVLASRAEKVEEAFAVRFPQTSTLSASMSNPEGYRAGRSAGRRANIGGPGLSRRVPALDF